MTAEETTRLGIEMLTQLMAQPPGQENDLSVMGSDPYKPFYRAIQIVMALFHDEDSLGRAPTMEETAAILRSSHPWFVRALDQSRDQFDDVWKTHYETWWAPGTGIYGGG